MKIRDLNKTLAKLDTWDETEINNRAKLLADVAIKAWTFPSVDLNNSVHSQNTSNQNNYERYLQGETLQLFEALQKEILNLDVSIKEEFKKKYIAYKTKTNFVDITPQSNRLRLFLNMAFTEIRDPQKICRDVTNIGHWGNGDVEVDFSSLSQIEDIMFLVRQAFQKHSVK